MPLTSKGKEALMSFKSTYGKNLGKSYFYAYMNKYPRRTKSWHRL